MDRESHAVIVNCSIMIGDNIYSCVVWFGK